MTRRILTLAAVISLPLIPAGCTTVAGISDPVAGFTTVEARTQSVTDKQAVWIQSSQQAQAVSARVKGRVQ